MAGAIAFVPVLFNFGLIAYCVPTGWGLVGAITSQFRGNWRVSFAFQFYAAAYLAIFYIAARMTFGLFSLSSKRSVRIGLQTITLCAIISCSFLRVITYVSIQGRGGTYNFWTAVERYFEKRQIR
ncbi:MAG: hypothetical protein ABI680_09960 [Chthoniobacteraceae bacterium]